MALNLENKKQILIIILAVGAGVVATVLAARYVEVGIKRQAAELADQVAQQQARFDQQQQAAGQEIAKLNSAINDLKSQQEASEQRQQQALAAFQAAQQQMKLQQQAAPQTAPKRKPSLALRTPPGKRAVTVMIDSLSAVGGLLNPGDFVDVIAQLKVPKAPAHKTDKDKEIKKETEDVTVMIFQNLQVLAVNTNLDDPGAYDEQQAMSSLKVTFAVDPQEAGLMAFADKNGKLELALRAPTEKKNQMLQASTWKTLADYVLQNHGATIDVPEPEQPVEEEKPKVEEEKPQETKPNIQIFRAGKEL